MRVVVRVGRARRDEEGSVTSDVDALANQEGGSTAESSRDVLRVGRILKDQRPRDGINETYTTNL